MKPDDSLPVANCWTSASKVKESNAVFVKWEVTQRWYSVRFQKDTPPSPTRWWVASSHVYPNFKPHNHNYLRIKLFVWFKHKWRNLGEFTDAW